jgi:hypothetical protein
MEVLDERAVDLDDLGSHQRHVPQPGITGAGVVERDSRAARAQGRQLIVEAHDVGDQLLLGDFDHDVPLRSAGSTSSTAAEPSDDGSRLIER